jgi:hypothetical protein
MALQLEPRLPSHPTYTILTTAPITNTFHLFPYLPPELWLKIWAHALPRRTVPFRLKLDMDAWNWSTEGEAWWTQFRLRPESPQPALPPVLHASAEARRELLRSSYPWFSVPDRILARCGLDAQAVRRDGEHQHHHSRHRSLGNGSDCGRGGFQFGKRNENGSSGAMGVGGADGVADGATVRFDDAGRFNPAVDVMRWGGPQRWSPRSSAGGGGGCGPAARAVAVPGRVAVGAARQRGPGL